MPELVREGQKPQVSVVIVNYNGQHHLQRCLPSLAATESVEFETILVDNGSSDGSVSWVQANFPWVRVLPLRRNLGFGAANHRGIAEARAELVALLNNDTVVEPGWLRHLVATLEQHPEAVAVCATLLLLQHPELYNARGGGLTWLGFGFDRFFAHPRQEANQVPLVEEVLFPTAAAALFRKRDFLQLGGFDPAYFMYHEDVDFGLRAWLSGKKVLLSRDAVVWHAFGGTMANQAGQRRRSLLGARHLVRTNLKCLEFHWLLRSSWNLAKLWWRQRAFGTVASVLLWNLWHLPGTLAARGRLRRVCSFEDLRKRGLVSEVPFPPEPPQLPLPVAFAELVPSPALLPGKDSARGRLGYGWYRVPDPRGAAWRLTSGQASLRLRVAPKAQGTLSLRLRRPFPHLPPASVIITANGQRYEAEVSGGEGKLVEVPVTADEQGLLHVVLQAPVVTGHHHLGNQDFRPLGLQVSEVRFATFAENRSWWEPRVSVVIPTHNRWRTLMRTLEALAQQTVPALQVVVVDDGSTDGTWARLQAWAEAHRRLPLLPLRQANRGPAAARNLGLRHAQGELVVFLGDDTIPEPDFLEAHLAAHRNLTGPSAVVGLTDWDKWHMAVTPFLRYVNREGEQFAYGLFHDGEDMAFTCFYTSNVSLPRELLGDSPFDETFQHAAWEDAELGYRLSLRGVRIVLCTQARVHHHHPTSLASFLQRQRKVGQALPTLLRLHPELAGDPALPPERPPWHWRVFWPFAPLLAPVAGWLDRAQVPLPKKLYKGLLLWAFYRGWQQAHQGHQR